MDCCICSAVAGIFRLPRNSICLSCYEGAQIMITIAEKMDQTQSGTFADEKHGGPSKSRLVGDQEKMSKGIPYALKMLIQSKEREKRLAERLSYLEGFVDAFREGIHGDIQVKGRDGSSKLAHKAILATKSPILAAMLDADECKAAPSQVITLPELGEEELECLLEFLYCGSLSKDKFVKHSHALLIAADKYEVKYLAKTCEDRILETLDPSNALQVLQLASLCHSERLKSISMETIVKHKSEIVFSDRYYDFVVRNAFLAVEVTRAIFMGANDEQETSTKP